MSYISVPPADEGECPTLLAARTTSASFLKVYRAQTRRPELIDAEVGLMETIVIEGRALTPVSKGRSRSKWRSIIAPPHH
jgi:hypothetical protein